MAGGGGKGDILLGRLAAANERRDNSILNFASKAKFYRSIVRIGSKRVDNRNTYRRGVLTGELETADLKKEYIVVD